MYELRILEGPVTVCLLAHRESFLLSRLSDNHNIFLT